MADPVVKYIVPCYTLLMTNGILKTERSKQKHYKQNYNFQPNEQRKGRELDSASFIFDSNTAVVHINRHGKTNLLVEDSIQKDKINLEDSIQFNSIQWQPRILIFGYIKRCKFL